MKRIPLILIILSLIALVAVSSTHKCEPELTIWLDGSKQARLVNEHGVEINTFDFSDPKRVLRLEIKVKP
jgi:hypothetical protein